MLAFVWNLFHSLRHGEPAGDDPWGGQTLEWATTSPPPEHNFDSLPPIRSERPLWDLHHPAPRRRPRTAVDAVMQRRGQACSSG